MPFKDVVLTARMQDFVIGLTLWGALDPSNFFAPPAVGPWVVAFAYGACVWGYAPVGSKHPVSSAILTAALSSLAQSRSTVPVTSAAAWLR